jgi:uncharacterized protein YndB with AHSA1/START domain
MSAASPTEAPAAERELVLTREFDAPRALVFAAFTDPAQVPAWWGPRGFTTTIHSMDVRPGGEWRYTMHGPDGTDYPNRVVYTEVARPERLAYDHGDDGGPWKPFHVTISFDDVAGRTRLTMRMVTDTVEEMQAMRRFGAPEGGVQTLDRLGEHLAAL